MFISYYFDNFSLIKESILYYLLRSKDVIYYNSSIQDQKCSKSQVLTFLLIFFLGLCVNVGVCMPCHSAGEQRTAFRSWFSPPTLLNWGLLFCCTMYSKLLSCCRSVGIIGAHNHIWLFCVVDSG